MSIFSKRANRQIAAYQAELLRTHCAEADLCCIIGNLFDNAIDASAALPPEQRQIRVYMDMKGTQLYISFRRHRTKTA